jgi:hypothetical protein
MSVDEKLLPCPFCGGEVCEKRMGWNVAHAECKVCGNAWGHCGSQYEGRIQKWNARAQSGPKPIDSSAIELTLTCGACPEQYDAHLNGARVGYLRLRHGRFYAAYPDLAAKSFMKPRNAKATGFSRTASANTSLAWQKTR